VDEYLSDNEQVERLRQWWRENGWYLLGGVALGALVLFGWNQYQAYRDNKAEKAAVLYESLQKATEEKNAVEATSLLSQLRSDYPSSAYTPQAGLLVASSLLIAAPDRAADELGYVMDHAKDDELAMVARLRLARVLAYREKYDDALALLEVKTPGKFAGRLNEIKGDIQAALGHVDEARAAYLAAMVADGSEVLDRNFLQMKLNDLPGAKVDAPTAPEPEAPAGAAPAPTPEAPAPSAPSKENGA
jgi:predicted negative regulator of RcsB-dependent stress response